MSHRPKLTLFVLAFNVIGFAEAICCRGWAAVAAADPFVTVGVDKLSFSFSLTWLIKRK